MGANPNDDKRGSVLEEYRKRIRDAKDTLSEEENAAFWAWYEENVYPNRHGIDQTNGPVMANLYAETLAIDAWIARAQYTSPGKRLVEMTEEDALALDVVSALALERCIATTKKERESILRLRALVARANGAS